MSGKPRHGYARRGMKRNRTYNAWAGMKQRCNDPKHKYYDRYGGRGINVCERWSESFEAFLADMGECPHGKSIDRFPNNDGNYEPGNCRWATAKEQNNNRSGNHLLEFQGKRLTISQWASELNINPGNIAMRVFRGWTIERALTTP